MIDDEANPALCSTRPGDQVWVEQDQWRKPGRSSAGRFVRHNGALVVVVHEGETVETHWYAWQVSPLRVDEYEVSWKTKTT